MQVKGTGSGRVRLLRVGEAVRHALSEILRRGDVHDPELAGASLTIGEVRVSPDLRHAEVYALPLGGVNEAAVIRALNRHAPYIRGQLAGKVRMKYLPKLHFKLDATFDEADRIESLLHDPKVARDLEGPPD